MSSSLIATRCTIRQANSCTRNLTIDFIQLAPNTYFFIVCVIVSCCRTYTSLNWSWSGYTRHFRGLRAVTSCRQSSVNIHDIQLANLFCTTNFAPHFIWHFTTICGASRQHKCTLCILCSLLHASVRRFGHLLAYAFAEGIKWELRSTH